MNKEDFNMLDSVVYLDNAATTLKPRVLAEAVSDYYNNYTANASRGDYKIALKVDDKINDTRCKVKTFIICIESCLVNAYLSVDIAL